MEKILQEELVKLAKELCEENINHGFDTFVMCYDKSDWLEFFDNYKVDTMWKIHRAWQLKMCREYSLIPSDCFFLATTGDPYYKRRRRMKYNPAARLCLTPLIEW